MLTLYYTTVSISLPALSHLIPPRPYILGDITIMILERRKLKLSKVKVIFSRSCHLEKEDSENKTQAKLGSLNYCPNYHNKTGRNKT